VVRHISNYPQNMGNDGISGLFSYVKRDSLYEYDLTNLTLKRNKVN